MTEVVGERTQETICQACKKPMFVETPIIRLVNQPEFSQIVFIHQKLETCPHCGQNLAAAVVNPENVQVQLAWLPVNTTGKGAYTSPEPDTAGKTDAKVLVRPQTNVKQ